MGELQNVFLIELHYYIKKFGTRKQQGDEHTAFMEATRSELCLLEQVSSKQNLQNFYQLRFITAV